MTRNYLKIKKYCDIFPDFALAFSWAKRKTGFYYLYPSRIDDILQELSIACILAGENRRLLNNLIGKRIYYLSKWSKQEDVAKPAREKKYNCKPKKSFVCAICGTEKTEYPRRNLLRNKEICGACYMRLKREDKKRNQI